MKNKIFLRIERGGVNGQYWQHLDELCSTLSLDATKAILWSIVYTKNQLSTMETKKNDNREQPNG